MFHPTSDPFGYLVYRQPIHLVQRRQRTGFQEFVWQANHTEHWRHALRQQRPRQIPTSIVYEHDLVRAARYEALSAGERASSLRSRARSGGIFPHS